MSANLKKYAFILIGVLLLTYTIIRAWRLSFTIDEASSYIYWCKGSYQDIIFRPLSDANNHVLNTLAMKFFSSWLPLSEVTLRIQSIVAHAMFLLFTWLLIKDFKNFRIKLMLYIVLNANGFIIDFFALARGYALSWAMMTGSLYFLKCFVNIPRRRQANILFAFVFSSAAVLANFTVLNYYFGLLAFYLGYVFLKIIVQGQRALARPGIWLSIISFGILSYAIVSFTQGKVSSIREIAGHSYWGKTGFWTDTVKSLFFFLNYLPFYDVVLGVIGFLLAVGGIYCVIYIMRRIILKIKDNGYTYTIESYARGETGDNFLFLMVLVFIFSVTIACINLEFYVMHIPFIFGRAAMFLEIMFLVIVAFSVDVIAKRWMYNVLSPFLTCISLIFFLQTFSFYYSRQWYGDADNGAFVKKIGDLQSTGAYKDKKEITLQISWYYYSSARFYKELYNFSKLKVVESKGLPNNYADFYFVPDTELYHFKNISVVQAAVYKKTHLNLLRNTKPTVATPFFYESLDLYNTVKANPGLYHNCDTGSIDNIKCVKVNNLKQAPGITFDMQKNKFYSDFWLKMRMRVYFPPGHHSGKFILTAFDTTGKIKEYTSLNFEDLFKTGNGWLTIPCEAFMSNINHKTGMIKAYIINDSHDDIYVSDMVMDISKL